MKLTIELHNPRLCVAYLRIGRRAFALQQLVGSFDEQRVAAFRADWDALAIEGNLIIEHVEHIDGMLEVAAPTAWQRVVAWWDARGISADGVREGDRLARSVFSSEHRKTISEAVPIETRTVITTRSPFLQPHTAEVLEGLRESAWRKPISEAVPLPSSEEVAR